MQFALKNALVKFAAAAAMMAMAYAPQARAENNYNITYPIGGTIFNDCNGENVSYSGTAHDVSLVTYIGNGNTYHVAFHGNISVSGVGLTTGARYTGSETYMGQFNIAAGVDWEAPYNFKLIGQGKTPNLSVHVTEHFTINANGIPTGGRFDVSIDCH